MKILQGVVILSNPVLRLFAVNVSEKDITIIKPQPDSILNIGDLIKGDLHDINACDCYNETRGEKIGISVEGVHCSIGEALYHIGLKWTQ